MFLTDHFYFKEFCKPLSNAGFTLSIRSTRSCRLPKVPDQTRSMACTRLLLERYSIIPDSHTTSTRLTTRSLLEHTDLFTNSSINTRFLHEQYSTNPTITRSSNGKTRLFTFSLHQCVLMSPSTKRLMRDVLILRLF